MSCKGKIARCPVCGSHFLKEAQGVASLSVAGALLLFDCFECAEVHESLLSKSNGKQNTNGAACGGSAESSRSQRRFLQEQGG